MWTNATDEGEAETHRCTAIRFDFICVSPADSHRFIVQVRFLHSDAPTKTWRRIIQRRYRPAFAFVPRASLLALRFLGCNSSMHLYFTLGTAKVISNMPNTWCCITYSCILWLQTMIHNTLPLTWFASVVASILFVLGGHFQLPLWALFVHHHHATRAIQLSQRLSTVMHRRHICDKKTSMLMYCNHSIPIYGTNEQKCNPYRSMSDVVRRPHLMSHQLAVTRHAFAAHSCRWCSLVSNCSAASAVVDRHVQQTYLK